ncbi:capsule assembly Wzi family protein [Psychromonas sp.]|uniref:capsule assembly Wzi family protein n=2 Tax=Gammaproteobacteria TaxID=1236 RepID=UPI003A97276A
MSSLIYTAPSRPASLLSSVLLPSRRLTALLLCLPSMAFASPWLEANDPFLRSSLVLLSDAGQLSAPVGNFPLRWSLLGDDLTYTAQSSDMVTMANQELLYTLNSARLNRGNSLFKVLNGTKAPVATGFGQFNEDEKGLYTSVEQLGNRVSYRLGVAYSEYQNDTAFTMDNSYVAVSAGAWLWSLGNVDRWWGQGWQHNLILGSYAKAAPDMSVSYVGQHTGLGVWSVESVLAQPSDSDYDYHSATRFVSKPFRVFEYGVTYQTWLSDIDASNDEQLALDAKITLPPIAHVYHSLYAEAASTADITEVGAWLVGWTGSFPMGQNTARVVLESQQSTQAHDTIFWKSGSYPSVTDDVANTTYLLDDGVSVAFYLQFQNDHQLGVIQQQANQDNETTNTSQLTYSLPALAGMVRLGAAYEQPDNSDSQTSLWAGYEFRF